MSDALQAILLPRLTAQEKQHLENNWGKFSATLMNRDGNNPKFENGGHRILHNPLLTQAILKIRDEYYALFNERRYIFKLPDSERKKQLLEDNDYDLVGLTHSSFERLQKPDYGFSEHEKQSILAHAQPQNHWDDYNKETHTFSPVSVKYANNITGSIIKRSIDSFELVFNREKTPRIMVPHVSPRASPEATGRIRSEPRDECPEHYIVSSHAVRLTEAEKLQAPEPVFRK